ncbi:MAG TPA: hypothetical protein VK996_13875 [Ramlibacter sp.]|nr:hypothetical protein [Ramlibacter sp.]
MPIRFSTQAANADKMSDDAPATAAPEAKAQPAGADPARDEAKPGKDINAAGFIKDKDAPKP